MSDAFLQRTAFLEQLQGSFVAALGPGTQLTADQLAHLRVAHSVVLTIVPALPIEERAWPPVLEEEFLEAIANDVVPDGYLIVDPPVPQSGSMKVRA